MIAFRSDLKIWIAAQPTDFRKSIHTLSALVSEALKVNPYGGDVFVFRSKRSDRVKLLAWDGSGMCWWQNGWSKVTSPGRQSATVLFISPRRNWRCYSTVWTEPREHQKL